MIRGAAGHVALVALLLAARTAVAAPPTHSFVEALRVDPNECFDAASLAPVLVRWLGRSEVDRRVEIEIAGQPAGAEGLTLRVRREGQIVGERRFPGLAAPCDEVRAAVGLAAALAVDALSLEVPAAPAAVVLERGPAPPVRSSSRRFSSAVDAVVLVGVLPAPTGALAPGFGVRLAPAFELRLGGLLSGVGSVGLDGGSVAASLLAGRADGCGALAGDIVRARACLGLAEIAGGEREAGMQDLSQAVASYDRLLGVTVPEAQLFKFLLVREDFSTGTNLPEARSMLAQLDPARIALAEPKEDWKARLALLKEQVAAR